MTSEDLAHLGYSQIFPEWQLKENKTLLAVVRHRNTHAQVLRVTQQLTAYLDRNNYINLGCNFVIFTHTNYSQDKIQQIFSVAFPARNVISQTTLGNCRGGSLGSFYITDNLNSKHYRRCSFGLQGSFYITETFISNQFSMDTFNSAYSPVFYKIVNLHMGLYPGIVITLI